MACGQPDARGSRQALDLLLFIQLQNGAGAKKTDAGDNSLNDVRLVVRCHA